LSISVATNSPIEGKGGVRDSFTKATVVLQEGWQKGGSSGEVAGDEGAQPDLGTTSQDIPRKRLLRGPDKEARSIVLVEVVKFRMRNSSSMRRQ